MNQHKLAQGHALLKQAAALFVESERVPDQAKAERARQDTQRFVQALPEGTRVRAGMQRSLDLIDRGLELRNRGRRLINEGTYEREAMPRTAHDVMPGDNL